ncbi:hypothetical protein ACLKA7_014102 [Drosophila subpalustris]
MGAVQPGAVVSIEHTWVHSTPYAALPPFAVVGGHDADGSPIYVGRSFHEGENLPAKVIPSKGCAYVCYGGTEHTKTHYEVLVGQGFAWVGSASGGAPPNAVRSGTTRTGEPLYVGRGHYANSLSVGKVHPSHGCLYIPFGGQEVRINTYEVLIYQQQDVWVPANPSFTPPGAVIAGHDSDRTPIYAGRAMHEGEMLPAKVVPSKGCAYVCFGGYEFQKPTYEVLTGYGYVWIRPHHHGMPPNAVTTGRARNGEPIYYGRGHHQGSLTPGLISSRQRCLYIPYGGREIRYKWVQSSSYSSIPPNAVVGGNDEDGAMIYVGRAEHEGDMLVCKVVPSKQIGFISQRGEALPKDIYEMLCGENLKWVNCYDHVIPETAVLCGRTVLDQPLYIGRGHYEGHLIIGKISSVHRALFIAYRGAERRLDSYEILVEEQRSLPGWQLPPPPSPLEEDDKCPLSPPPPPPPPPAAVRGKPYPYPPDFDAVAFPLNDRPPQYTPMPMPSTDPYPPPTPTILPSYQSPVGMAPPLPPKPAMPPSYVPAQVAPPSTLTSCSSAASFVPAETYKPPMDPYAPSCSSYTPAEYAPAAVAPPVYGATSTHVNNADLWLPASAGYTPPDAVYGGHDSDMAPLLVCRAFCEGLRIPGKAVPSRGCAYIAHSGREIVESSYEVLIGQGKYHWVPRAEGSIAPGAVEAGRSYNGEPLYVGRARYCGSLTPGKIQQSHRCIHIPFGGQEVHISSYEVLVRSDIFHRQQAINLSY